MSSFFYLLQVIQYNQNVEKLQTLSAKLTSKIDDLLQSKEELLEDFNKVAEKHAEATKIHKNLNSKEKEKENNGTESRSAF